MSEQLEYTFHIIITIHVIIIIWVLKTVQILQEIFKSIYWEAYVAPSTTQGQLWAFCKFKSYTCRTKNNVAFKKQYTQQKYTKTNKKTFFKNLKIVFWVLPLCTIATKLGHAGIVDLSV